MRAFIFCLFWGLLSSAGFSQSRVNTDRSHPFYKPGLAITAQAATSGFGVGLGKSISPHLAFRAGANLFNYTGTLVSGSDNDQLQIGFDYTVKLTSVNALIDYYPFSRAGFRLTAGAYYNLNTVTFLGKPTKDVRFNDVVFTIDQIGTINGKASFNKIAPYVGIGWGHPFIGNRLTFMVDIGMFYQQSPRLDFVTTGMLEPSNDQGPIIQKNLEPLKYYPILSVGLAYNIRFSTN